MINPYEAPQATLDSELLPMRKKIGWKIYFWCYLCIEFLGVGSMIFGGENMLFDIVGEIIVYSFALLGIFAFAYNKKIASPVLWRIVMLALIAWDGYIFINAIAGDEYKDLDLVVIYFVVAFVAIMLFLQYFVLYQYAYQSKEIWNQPEKKGAQ